MSCFGVVVRVGQWGWGFVTIKDVIGVSGFSSFTPYLLLLVAIVAPQPQSLTYVPLLQSILPRYSTPPLQPTPYVILELSPYALQPHPFPSPPSPQYYPPPHPSLISLLLQHPASTMPLSVTHHPVTYQLVFPMPDSQRTS